MKEWLSKKEVEELTGKIRPSAQLRQLKSLEMMHRVHFRTDGSFVVMREKLEQTSKPPKEYKMDFSGFGHGTQAA